jgi:putative endonuclease
MRTAAQHAGDAAEAAVAAGLAGRGWRILATNLRVGRAEIDVLAVDPGPPAALVVVEVRWRSRRDFGLAEETVDARKRARLRRAGHALRELDRLPDGSGVPALPMRFDLIAAEPGGRLRHHRHGA